MIAILIISFAILIFVHMGIAFSIRDAFGKIQNSCPEYKEQFSLDKSTFLNTPAKQNQIIGLCRKINTNESLRLIKLMLIDNAVLGMGVVLILGYGIIDLITK